MSSLDLGWFVEYAFDLLPSIYICIQEKWKENVFNDEPKKKMKEH